MANTTNFGWETPDDTDLVKDGAAAMRTLGSSIDTSFVDLKGGTTGQILSKATNTDLDYTWITNDVGDITAVTVTSPITGGGTSGSVGIAIQDASTSQRGSVQLSDSTSTTSSVLAATPTAVKATYDLATTHIPGLSYVSGRYYKPQFTAATTQTSSLSTANVTYYLPIYIRENYTFTRIAMTTGTNFSGTGSLRLGIYNNTSGAPSTVLLDAGTVTPIASGTVYEITISQALTPGWYWLAINNITSATTNTFHTVSGGVSTSTWSIVDLGSQAPGTTGNYIGYTQSVNASAGFATASPTLSSGVLPLLALKA
jgi:hypothetical protein